MKSGYAETGHQDGAFRLNSDNRYAHCCESLCGDNQIANATQTGSVGRRSFRSEPLGFFHWVHSIPWLLHKIVDVLSNALTRATKKIVVAQIPKVNGFVVCTLDPRYYPAFSACNTSSSGRIAARKTRPRPAWKKLACSQKYDGQTCVIVRAVRSGWLRLALPIHSCGVAKSTKATLSSALQWPLNAY